MDDWSDVLFPLFILVSSLGLMVWHVWSWRWAKREDLAPAELNYRWRQFRRRIQTSAMLAILALAIFAAPWISAPVYKLALIVGILILVLWVAALAIADLVATRFHFARLRDGYRVEQLKLEAEARRLRGLRGNGKPGSGGSASRRNEPE